MNDFSKCPTEGAIGLLSLLIGSGRQAEAGLDDALNAAGLTFIKWRTLDVLVKAGEPIGLKLLPERLGCVKSNVTQLVDKLEAEGVVRRVADPGDRRSLQVELTEAGRQAHRTGREALESATVELFKNFDHDDREALRERLKLLGSKQTEKHKPG